MSEMLRSGVEANTFTYNTVIKACADVRDMAKVEHWLSKMKKAGVQEDAFLYTTLMRAYGREGSFEKVEQCLQQMRSRKLRPDAHTFWRGHMTAHGPPIAKDDIPGFGLEPRNSFEKSAAKEKIHPAFHSG